LGNLKYLSIVDLIFLIRRDLPVFVINKFVDFSIFGLESLTYLFIASTAALFKGTVHCSGEAW
jgi:hypothetical protein